MATASEISAFIKLLGRLAVNEANNRIASGKAFVLPSVCIAQSAIETGWGTAGIMVKANAFFGIKAGGSWTGKVYRADTWEVADGTAYNTTANFRAYDSLEASVKDYYDLIGNSSRYSKALSFGTDKGAWKTPRACITAIWAGGYATDTLYVEKIMNTITSRDLTAYDNLVDGEGVLTEYDTNNAITFTADKLVDGGIAITDSGRSWQVDSTIIGVSLILDNAITVEKETRLLLEMPANYVLYPFTLIDDTATATEEGYATGSTITIPAGHTFAFTIKNTDGLDNVPTPTDVASSLKLIYPTTLPDGTEIATSVIAHFVKIQ